jgi:tetratricopeptide (TPR) repeat protein
MRTMLLSLTMLAAAIPLGGLAGCRSRVDSQTTLLFEEAQEAFQNAKSRDDYLTAAGLYQQILERGVVSGVVLYNQGNALMRAERRGLAIAAYRRAQHLRPRDPYLESNLRYALGPEADTGRRRSWMKMLLLWQDWLSDQELWEAATMAAALACLCGLARLWWRPRVLGGLALASLAVALLFSAAVGYDGYRHAHATGGVIIDSEAVARRGNARSFEPAWAEPLGDGVEFQLVECRNGWLCIRLSDGREGWVERGHAALYD